MKIVVLISGEGSNLQAIIDAMHASKLDVSIQAVISNKPDAYGLIRAEQYQIPKHVIRSETELHTLLHHYNPELIVLAGFMRVLSKEFVTTYAGKIINIHPSLLPKYRGLNTHERVLANKEAFHGTSIHFVTEQLDGGPVIAQQKVKVETADTRESLRERIVAIEHLLYPKIIQLLAHHRLTLSKTDTILFDGRELKKPICLTDFIEGY